MPACASCGQPLPDGPASQTCPHCGHVPPSLANEFKADPAGAAALSLRVLKLRYPRLLMLWIPAVVLDLAGSLALAAYQSGAGFPEDLASMTQGQQLQFLGFALPIAAIVFGVRLALWGIVAALVLDTVDGKDEAVPAAMKRAPLFLGVGFLLMLAYSAGLVLLIVPFLVFFHWFMFAPAALASGAKGVGDAFEASRRFARERRTFGFTALVLFAWFSVFLVYLIVGSSVIGALDAGGLGSPYVQAIVSPLVSWLVAPVLPLFPAAYWALVARNPAMAPPNPEAPATERFRTTKCPDCGTLVPYTATGEPVDVQCPVCGRQGRVV